MDWNRKENCKHVVAGFVACVVFVCLASLSFSFFQEDIKIAMITAKTGEAGKSNAVSFKGAQFAVDTINEHGGILGRDVQLLEYDNLSTPEGSAAAARQAIADGVVAVVGCNWSSHSLAMAKVLQAAHIPMISHMSTNEAVTKVGDYIFRACFTDSFQGVGLARFSLDTLGALRAVVLVDMSRTYSKGLAQTFTEAFEAGGGTLVWRGEYDSAQFDAEFLLREVARISPDVLFVPGGYSDVADIFGKARAYGVRTHLLSGDGIGIKMYDRIGNRANGIYFSGHWSRWVDTPQSKDFVRRYEKKMGPVPEDTLALVYDSFMVLKDAIERAQSVEPSDIRDALAETPGHEGVTGVIRFDGNGDPIKPMVINRFKFGGIMYVDQVYP